MAKISLCAILGLGAGLLAQCSNEGRDSRLFIDIATYNPVAAHLAWSQNSLTRWDIGLNATENTGLLRNITPEHVANPPHWITVSGSDCDSKGVPETLRENCSFANNSKVVGVCLARANIGSELRGQIIDTTILIRKSYLDDASIADAEKEAAFIHEIGHCLGLQHWGNSDNSDSGLEPAPPPPLQHEEHIMFPTTLGTASLPHASELEAIKTVYAASEGCSSSNPMRECIKPQSLPSFESCSQWTGGIPNTDYIEYEDYIPCYYSQVKISQTSFGPERIYHSRFPSFVISASIGNAASIAPGMHKRGPPLEGELMTIMYLLKADGSEDIRYLSD